MNPMLTKCATQKEQKILAWKTQKMRVLMSAEVVEALAARMAMELAVT